VRSENPEKVVGTKVSVSVMVVLDSTMIEVMVAFGKNGTSRPILESNLYYFNSRPEHLHRRRFIGDFAGTNEGKRRKANKTANNCSMMNSITN
jgi:hypothetical protein